MRQPGCSGMVSAATVKSEYDPLEFGDCFRARSHPLTNCHQETPENSTKFQHVTADLATLHCPNQRHARRLGILCTYYTRSAVVLLVPRTSVSFVN